MALGSFVEEIIAPIPSPLVSTISGSLSKTQGHPLIFLFWLAVLGAAGKTAGAYLLYSAADRVENFISKYEKMFLPAQTETKFLRKKSGHGWKDYFFLFIARVSPIIPSAPLSISCGLIKLSLLAFLAATFTGTVFRNLIFLYFGYSGVNNYQSIIGGFENAESILQLAIFVSIFAGLIWLYLKRGMRINPSLDAVEEEVIGKDPLSSPRRL